MDQLSFLIVYQAWILILTAFFITRGSLWRFLANKCGIGVVAAIVISNLAYYYGLQHLDPASHSLIVRSYVIYGMLISVLFLGEKLTGFRATLGLLCVLGTILCAWPDSPDPLRWMAAAITSFAALMFAVYSALLRAMPGGASVFSALFLSSVMLVPSLYIYTGSTISDVAGSMVNLPAFLAALFFTSSLYVYNISARYMDFFGVSALRAGSPIAVMILAYPIFGLSLTWFEFLGIIIVIVSLWALFSEHQLTRFMRSCLR
ncbi:hypothetical protein GCM10007094_02350 [Pseudovibrio japonicus]|uniref:EamA domain-containing protein n=2 Tax=Pseudovibrio japonicus TaxID=366534 RepID=A0ABQ3DXI3_9HYPH|nr:hypothetical protein GCM10007094_02350 [Pseudovibrio japonicus]